MARAERARACLLLADRFTTDPEQEDLSILFQVGSVYIYISDCIGGSRGCYPALAVPCPVMIRLVPAWLSAMPRTQRRHH